jgi:hypothetical protein
MSKGGGKSHIGCHAPMTHTSPTRSREGSRGGGEGGAGEQGAGSRSDARAWTRKATARAPHHCVPEDCRVPRSALLGGALCVCAGAGHASL